mmetsp:Transcript_28283/g.79456  ORF Transcript_28283/g.79456 Transcript_28283/m.79456 type:complete len:246 (-) Transcript_28283:1687-2424(-)
MIVLRLLAKQSSANDRRASHLLTHAASRFRFRLQCSIEFANNTADTTGGGRFIGRRRPLLRNGSLLCDVHWFHITFFHFAQDIIHGLLVGCGKLHMLLALQNLSCLRQQALADIAIVLLVDFFDDLLHDTWEPALDVHFGGLGLVDGLHERILDCLDVRIERLFGSPLFLHFDLPSGVHLVDKRRVDTAWAPSTMVNDVESLLGHGLHQSMHQAPARFRLRLDAQEYRRFVLDGCDQLGRRRCRR